MRIKTRDMTLTALFTVLTIIGGKITVPFLMIPFTLQSVVCLLAGILIGPRLAMLSQLLYVAIGLIGLPVFASGGGLAYVLQPSFGYLPGMLLASGLVGWLTGRLDPDRSKLKLWQLLPVNLAGQLVIYAVGVSYLFLIKNIYAGQNYTFIKALEVGLAPFLLADTLKSVLAAFIGLPLRRATRPFFFRSAAG